MNILIVDDEHLARERLVSLISELDLSASINEAENGMAALDSIHKDMPDIVLLDIRMPLMDGLEVAHHLTRFKMPPAVIFTTAYQDHALDAFDAHAVDYLLKPIRKDRLAQALQKAQLPQRAQIAHLRTQKQLQTSRTHLSALVKGNIKLVPINEIHYLKADEKYVIAAWPGGELLLDEPLKSLESELETLFVRIHRNALVALQYIEALEKGNENSVAIRLRDIPHTLQVSRRHVNKIRRLIKTLGK